MDNKITCDYLEEVLESLHWEESGGHEEYLYDKGMSLLHVLSNGERGAYKCPPSLSYQQWQDDGWPKDIVLVTDDVVDLNKGY